MGKGECYTHSEISLRDKAPSMALREFNIPFGPDKTGGLGFAELGIEEETEEVKDPFAEPPKGAFARDTSHVKAGLPAEPDFQDIDGFSEEAALPPTERNPEHPGATSIPAVPIADPRPAVRSDATQPIKSEAEPGDYNDVSHSFAALRSSIGQSRELKARERELEEFRTQLRLDREELADRQSILNDYESLVAQQDKIIREATEIREEDKAELAAIAQEIEDTEAELAELQEYHNQQMQPLETELGRAKASVEQAKNDERSRKSELNAAETELRRAGTGGDATMLQAKVDQIHEAYEKAKDISAQAADILKEVQRIYDDAADQIQQTEGPLERSIQDLEQHEADLKERIADLGEDISVARKRRQYCDAVYQYPDETAKLQRTVEEDDAELKAMEEDYRELEGLLAQSKANARKAKVAIGLVIAIIVIFVVALAVILLRL